MDDLIQRTPVFFGLIDGGFIASRPGQSDRLLRSIDGLREFPGFGVRRRQSVEHRRITRDPSRRRPVPPVAPLPARCALAHRDRWPATMPVR